MPFIPNELRRPFCPYCIGGEIIIEAITKIPKCRKCNKKVLLSVYP